MAIQATAGKLHWNYFLALDRDLEVVSRYVEFTKPNFNVYSIELAHLLFAAASEVDVVYAAEGLRRATNAASAAYVAMLYLVPMLGRLIQLFGGSHVMAANLFIRFFLCSSEYARNSWLEILSSWSRSLIRGAGLWQTELSCNSNSIRSFVRPSITIVTLGPSIECHTTSKSGKEEPTV